MSPRSRARVLSLLLVLASGQVANPVLADRPRAATPLPAAPSRALRLWILPFEHTRSKDQADVGRAIPELLTIFFSSAGHAVVEREHLDRILAEHAVNRDGLVAPSRRIRIGRVLGATAMITGSCVREGENLAITAHVTDIASGRVLASARTTGSERMLAETLRVLYRDLVANLAEVRPQRGDGRVEPAPLEDLHLLRGLSYFYAARYSQALAELFQCGEIAERDGLPGWWRARCYLARAEYGLAYLELVRLKRSGLGSVSAAEHEGALRVCRARLAPDETRTYDRLVTEGEPSSAR